MIIPDYIAIGVLIVAGVRAARQVVVSRRSGNGVATEREGRE
jgi:hypothetical protein